MNGAVAPGKSPWKSKTLWGIALLVLPRLLERAGVPLGPDDVEAVLTGVSDALGSLLAVWGRFSAREKIQVKSPAALWSLVGLVLLLPLAGLFSGCQFVTENPELARAGVGLATLRVIDGDAGKAARVEELADFIVANAGNETAMSVALLEAAVRAKINWTLLRPDETYLVNRLIDAVRVELVKRLGDGVLRPEQRLVVAEVAAWIREAARTVPRSSP